MLVSVSGSRSWSSGGRVTYLSWRCCERGSHTFYASTSAGRDRYCAPPHSEPVGQDMYVCMYVYDVCMRERKYVCM